MSAAILIHVAGACAIIASLGLAEWHRTKRREAEYLLTQARARIKREAEARSAAARQGARTRAANARKESDAAREVMNMGIK
jgi:hypothetical protein